MEVPIDRWINKEEVVYIYTMEYYSAIKKNEILPFSTTWMDLEGIMLTEIRQTGKDKYHTVLFVCGTSKTKQVSTGNKTETELETPRTNWWLPERERVGSCVKEVKGLGDTHFQL